MSGRVTAGLPAPIGVTPDAQGVNVAVYSSTATRIEFCLFDVDGNVEIERIPLDQRTGDVFHAHVAGIEAGQRYGLRAHGPYDPPRGQRFNPAKLLVDPHALQLDRRFALHPAQNGFSRGDPFGADAIDPTDSAPFVPKAIVNDRRALAGAEPATRIAWPDAIVYELHVRGFTQRHPQIPAPLRGTFAALAHPAAIAHLRRIGVTTVELMPAAAWIDERHLPALGLSNYWGYNPIAMLAPDPRLAPGGWAEVRAAVEALHAAGLEVILDVVLNHSGESDEFGPTLSLRGLDNAGYYRLAPDAPARYINDTGCGNCLALARPAVVDLACAALRTWIELAGVDGFRFDLGTTLGRHDNGFDAHAPLLEAIAADPTLGAAKLIVEPWDVGPGGYQLGRFPESFAEWNDRFRDDARRFWRGDAGARGDLATRLAGSADLLAAKRLPSRGINFVAAHDGFTLADVATYAHKHNDANGEHGRDGSDANYSWNHGVEGDTTDARVIAARTRDQRNLLATLLLARGTPMLAMGAELGHSQHGNNNAYAQDNASSWLDWARVDEGLVDFVAALVTLRRAHPALRTDAFLAGTPPDDSSIPDVEWRTADATLRSAQDWNERDGDPLVAVLYAPAANGTPADRVALALQRADATAAITLPTPRPGHAWRCVFDSAHPHLAAETGRADTFAITPRSVCVFTETAAPAADGGIGDGSKIERGVDGRTLVQLAAAAGIAADWWEVEGTRHVVSPDTQRALLAAMRLPAATNAQARESLARIAGVRERRTLPFALAAREGETIELPIVANDVPAPGTLLVRDEAGTIVATVPCPDAFASDRRDVAGYALRAANARLPALGAGRYEVFRDADPELACRLTVAPRTCFTPDWLAAGGRRFGVSAQAYALRRADDGGIGDFGAIGELGAAAARHGAVTLGINPLHMLFPHARDRASPYHPSDRRFLDPIYLDIGALQDIPGFANAVVRAPAPVPDDPAGFIDYAAVWSRKRMFLERLFDAFEAIARAHPDDARAREHAAFVATGGHELAVFAAFESISATDPARRWQDWPVVLRDAHGAAVRTLVTGDGRRLRFARFLQWLAERQLAQATAKARDAGLTLGLYRDLAVGCAPDGAEAWATQRQLARGASIGAPPDPLGPLGQVWNLPPPDPLAWHEHAFASLRSVVAANMRHAGALRIDHALGLARLFWVPDGAHAADGAYVHYPLAALVGEIALESRRASCVVIGEDLGTVPEGLRETLAGAGMLSYRVLMLERERAAFRPAATYPPNAVACAATHDLPPLAGWWSGDDLHERHALGLLPGEAFASALATRVSEKRELLRALAAEGLAPESDIDAMVAGPLRDATSRAIHLWLARAPSALMLVQVEDLAHERVSQNLPGTDRERPNWRRRLPLDVAGLFAQPGVRELLAALAAARPRND